MSKQEEHHTSGSTARKSTRFSSVAKSLIAMKKAHGNITPDELITSSNRPTSSAMLKSTGSSSKMCKIPSSDYSPLSSRKKFSVGSINAGRTNTSR